MVYVAYFVPELGWKSFTCMPENIPARCKSVQRVHGNHVQFRFRGTV